jgi:hypothetical protein
MTQLTSTFLLHMYILLSLGASSLLASVLGGGAATPPGASEESLEGIKRRLFSAQTILYHLLLHHSLFIYQAQVLDPICTKLPTVRLLFGILCTIVA